MPSSRPPARDPGPGSPAATVTLGAGVLALLVSLADSAYVVSLFLSGVALAALPLALGDRAGGAARRKALVGALAAVAALVLVLVPLLFGEQQRADRDLPPIRTSVGPFGSAAGQGQA